jgi:3''5''-cyclic nucleotide phosphodiesterase.
MQEFYDQGDLEKSLGFPVSMYCDREKPDYSKSVAGFIKNIACPLFYSLNEVLGSTQIEEKCVLQLVNNQLHWENKRKDERVHSLVVNKDPGYIKTLFLPRKESRKISLPDKYMS